MILVPFAPYHERYTMAELIPLQEAYDELDAIYEIDAAAAAQFDVLLEHLADDTDMLERLFRPANHYKYTPPFEIKIYGEMQKRGKNIFTIRVLDEDGALLPYRALMGYHAQIDTYYLLAVLQREIAYDTTDPAFRAVVERYEQAGIPTYPH